MIVAKEGVDVAPFSPSGGPPSDAQPTTIHSEAWSPHTNLADDQRAKERAFPGVCSFREVWRVWHVAVCCCRFP